MISHHSTQRTPAAFPARHDRATHAPRRAFTLVEILIVIVILGILAAIVIPQFTAASEDSRRTAFIADLNTYEKAAFLMHAQTGQLPEDSSSGEVPAGFEEYININAWLDGTPIGGVWDAEYQSFGVTSAIGVHFNGTGDTQDEAYMTLVDQIGDDGDLETGSFGRIANDRYYTIIVR